MSLASGNRSAAMLHINRVVSSQRRDAKSTPTGCFPGDAAGGRPRPCLAGTRLRYPLMVGFPIGLALGHRRHTRLLSAILLVMITLKVTSKQIHRKQEAKA